MSFKRRQFLQFASSALAAVGLSQLDIRQQGLRYAKVLAQSTPRKLALLVGVNEYRNSDRFTNLYGCVKDVELQRQLLVNRFRFNESDIATLTDDTAEKPTRDNILKYFEEHLIKQARPGDIVVFHFSGHGARITDPNPIRDASGNVLDPLNSTLVPSDAQEDTEIVPDIMGRTLFLLTSALQTDQVTVVLDSCYSGGGTRGNVRIRSADICSNCRPSDAELEYQRQWLSALSLSPEEFSRRRDISVAQGVVIASALRNQSALDVTFNGFDAGAFTCLMTQYLWQEAASVERTVANVSRSLQEKQFPQTPVQEVQANREFDRQPIYFVNDVDASQTQPTEAVVIGRNRNRGTVWLGGVDPENLIAFDTGASFTTVGTNGEGNEVKVLSRNGLTAEVELPESIAVGTALQESARVIPPVTLRVGIDPSFGNEMLQVEQLLKSIRRVEPVLPQSVGAPYAGEVQYILGRVTAERRRLFQQREVAHLPNEGSISLFSQSLDEVLPDSFDKSGETVEDAIARLTPKLTSLVAARIIRLMLNANSSRLSIEVAIEREGQSDTLVASSFTVRGSNPPSALEANESRQLPINEPFRFRVVNREAQPLYVSVLIVAPSGEINVLFPNQYTAAEETARIEANQTLLIPDSADPFKFFPTTKGVGEALIIASRLPLRRALIALRNLAREQQLPERGAFVTPTVEAIGDLLSDLNTTRSDVSSTVLAQLHVTEMAAMSITFEVI